MATCKDPYIDPQMRALLEAMPPAAPEALDVVLERQRMTDDSRLWNRPSPTVATVEELSLAGPHGPIPLRCYYGAPDRVVVYLHGGGWCLGSNDTHDRLQRLLCLETGATVLGVDYRLAPEYPYPVALDEVLAVVAALGDGTLLQPPRIALAGDSAGANLALGSLLRLRDQSLPLPVGAALLYGCFQDLTDTPSHRAFGDGRFGLSTARMQAFWQHYLGTTGRGVPYAEPLRADLHGLPPLYLNGAGLDCLLDDTRLLVERLADAGVHHDCRLYPGVVHGFMKMTATLDIAMAALREAARVLQRWLA